MDGVAFQSEAHQDGLDAKDALEVGDDGDAAAAAHGQGVLAECFGETFLCGLIGRQIDGADVAFAAVHGGDFHSDRAGRNGLDVVHEEAGYFLVLLVWNEPA